MNLFFSFRIPISGVLDGSLISVINELSGHFKNVCFREEIQGENCLQ